MPGRKNKAIHLNNEGNVMYRRELYEVAIECYTKAVELDPTNSSFYGNRGQAYFKRELYEESVNDALMSVKLDEKFWKGFVRAGKGMVKLGRLDEATTYFTEAKKYVTDGGEAEAVADFELDGLKHLQRQVAAIHEKYGSREYYSASADILLIQSSIPRSYELKMLLCECNYHRNKYSLILKTASVMKREFHLTQAQHQTVAAMEMKAFAALSAKRLGGSDLKQVQDNENHDLYEILEVKPSAKPGEISSAYTAMALRYHPERQTVYVSDEEKKDLTKKFLTVTRAFIILSDDTLKALYDLGYSEDTILCEDIDFPAVFCSVTPPPSSSSWSDTISYHLKKTIFWTCSPVTATATCPCWFPCCARTALCSPPDSGWLEELKFKLLSHKRDNMLEAALAKGHKKKA